jgi:hypothetical protein
LALAGLGAACAYFEPEVAPPPPAAVAPPPLAALPPPAALPPRPARKPLPPPSGSAPIVAPPESGTPAPAAFDPEILRGMRPEEVADVLGEPWQRAESAPATVWRYVSRLCELDLYFYLDLQSKVTRVLDLDFRPADYGRQRCIDQLVADRQAREGSSAGASSPR